MSAAPDLAKDVWRKSTYSGGNGGQCVEVARNLASASGLVPVRDSKDPEGPMLVFPAASWQAFIDWAKAQRV
ncbi:DUF397 domain-containing protein [Streptomyces pactum]|uniref:DUF397 domain-containing protein n=1 Tax=Streptomyces pactum TaxID=68249 RepID=A0ABS0NQR5_9ACTN|nr:DUF397 domain-containing protein [Streptomyces pactum]MBH5337544.1 DUF397 domain-containing protein [Streptomyces pactum]